MGRANWISSSMGSDLYLGPDLSLGFEDGLVVEAQCKMVGLPMKEGFIPSFDDLSYSLVSSMASEETETGSLAAVSSSPCFLVVGERHCSYIDED